VRTRYDRVVTLVSPPRSCSTALARAFWEHPALGFYAHEPFDMVYFERAPLSAALEAMLQPLDLARVARRRTRQPGLLVKEMSFQVGPAFPLLLELATPPLVFLVRDPRLTIRSRMRMRELGGEPPEHPSLETGWPDLCAQIVACEERGVPYVVVDATELRARPVPVLRRLCRALRLDFDEAMLRWSPASGVRLGHLRGRQDHWYARVLASTGIEPPDEPLPPTEEVDGLRRHVARCVAAYRILRAASVEAEEAA
jgi:hypothetical protein